MWKIIIHVWSMIHMLRIFLRQKIDLDTTKLIEVSKLLREILCDIIPERFCNDVPSVLRSNLTVIVNHGMLKLGILARQFIRDTVIEARIISSCLSNHIPRPVWTVQQSCLDRFRDRFRNITNKHNQSWKPANVSF